MLFDSHTHLNNDTITDEEREALVLDIEASDLSYVMDVGFDLESSRQAIDDAEANSWCYAAVGVHPHDTDQMNEEILESIKDLAAHEKVMAIGEIGLDYHYDNSERDAQKYWFRRQIRLANELKLPIIIHSREADEDTMNILKEEGAFSRDRRSWFPKRKGPDGEELPDSRVLIHCFSSSKEIARQYVKLGATIGICGPVTYKNNRRGKEVVLETPLEFLTVETDAPYLTPEPFRGRKNKSPYVEYTARKVAELKEMEYSEVARITCENAKRFFDIK
ncbi:MAG: TatD family hydrolase [Eubacteriaceae bacterium]|nr:TatD family hydrolase [Eubacteriaceae bacterium]